MKLFHAAPSPFVRKVAITAIELGIADRIERIDAATTPMAPDAELAVINPLAKLPALITDDGEALYDSSVICEYLATEHGGGAMLPPSGTTRWTALRLQSLADGMLDASVLRRYEVAMRPEEHRSKEWDDGQRLKVARSLRWLDREAATLGETPTLGTIAVACALGYLDFRFADEDWRSDHPHLARWHETNWAARPSFTATKPPA